MTHYERMDIEDRGGSDANYPRFSEDQFFDMGTFENVNSFKSFAIQYMLYNIANDSII